MIVNTNTIRFSSNEVKSMVDNEISKKGKFTFKDSLYYDNDITIDDVFITVTGLGNEYGIAATKDDEYINYNFNEFKLMIDEDHVNQEDSMDRIYYNIHKDGELYRLAYCYSGFDWIKREYKKHGYTIELVNI